MFFTFFFKTKNKKDYPKYERVPIMSTSAIRSQLPWMNWGEPRGRMPQGDPEMNKRVKKK